MIRWAIGLFGVAILAGLLLWDAGLLGAMGPPMGTDGGMVANPATVQDCAEESILELETLCMVQVAGVAGTRGDQAEVNKACGALTGFWAEECHFRGGEELARSGRVRAGLQHCGLAGRFARFCLSHVVWGAHPLGVELSELPDLAAPFLSLPALPQETPAESLLRSRWWFDQYVGSGAADPAMARSASELDAPYARTAWGIEAVRLAEGNLEQALLAWSGSAVLQGAPLPAEQRIGRYDLPFDIPGEAVLPRIPTFGGGKRLLGATEAEDVQIAVLEGAYFRERTGAQAFRPFLDDSRLRVRYTALRCFRTLPSPGAEALLRTMVDDADPIVAAHVADALKFRTWEGKQNAPGLRSPR